MKKISLTIISLVLMSGLALAQEQNYFKEITPVETKTDVLSCGEAQGYVFGNPESNERGYCVAATPEQDGFYLAGSQSGRVMITKMALNGNIYWARTFDVVPGNDEHVHSMMVDSDGMIAISGTSGQSPLGSPCFVIRYDPYLNLVLWAKEYSFDLENFSIIEKGQSGNYLISNTRLSIDTTGGGQILEIDKQNGIVKESVFLPPLQNYRNIRIADMIYEDHFIYGVGMYFDQYFIDFKQSFDEGNFRNLLVKIDGSNMNVVWSNSGHFPVDTFAEFKGNDLLMINKEIYSCYHGRPPGSLKDKIYIQKTDLNGNLLWLKEYSTTKPVLITFEMIHSANGIVVLAGQLSNLREFILFKVDYNGEVLWSRKFRSDLFIHDIFYELETRSSQLIQVDTQLIFTAYSVDPAGPNNLVLIKTNLNGESAIPCIENLLLDLQWITIHDPVFYPQGLYSDSMGIKEATLVPQEFDLELKIHESCVRADTVYSTLDTTICEGEVVEGHDASGTYIDTFTVNTGCDSIRILNLTVLPPFQSLQEVQICHGESYEGYGKSGFYSDTFPSLSGCDSIRLLRLNVIHCLPTIVYNLNACRSYMFDGSLMDYSEFTPEYLNILSCANVSAGYLFRDPPANNKHSCTPGIEGSPAMCVTTMNSCTYAAGNDASVVIEFTVEPEVDSVVVLTGLEFFEKGPTEYNWIDGGNGPNNYPLFYGIRILKNNIEIFRKENIPTSPVWTLQSYDFLDEDLFKVDENSTFRIELLSYCPVGNGADVSAWDLDEIKIYAGCVSPLMENATIHGSIFTKEAQTIPNTIIYLADNSDFSEAETKVTEDEGYFLFDPIEKGTSCFLKGYKNDDILNGVSTLDLIHIQKHLLGITPFTSLHQYIAADVNRNENVSVTDLLELRKVLLGINAEFPRNTSWRFGPWSQDMSGANLSSFQEISSIEYITSDTVVVDFVGIKVGDLNGDALLPARQNKVIVRHEDEVSLLANNMHIKEGIPFTIDIRLSEEINIAGIQLAFQLKDLKLLNAVEGKLPISSDHFSITPDGLFKLSWSQAEAIHIRGNEVLFSLSFVANYAGDLEEHLDLAYQYLAPEIYTINDDRYRLNLTFADLPSNEPVNTYFVIEPNPFHAFATVRFNMATSGIVTMRFFDVSGKLLGVVDKDYTSGAHSEQINNDILRSNGGIIYCQFICNGYTGIQRLVRIQ